MSFYTDVKEMTTFLTKSFTKVMGAVFAYLKSRPGKKVAVSDEQQSCSY